MVCIQCQQSIKKYEMWNSSLPCSRTYRARRIFRGHRYMGNWSSHVWNVNWIITVWNLRSKRSEEGGFPRNRFFNHLEWKSKKFCKLSFGKRCSEKILDRRCYWSSFSLLWKNQVIIIISHSENSINFIKLI